MECCVSPRESPQTITLHTDEKEETHTPSSTGLLIRRNPLRRRRVQLLSSDSSSPASPMPNLLLGSPISDSEIGSFTQSPTLEGVVPAVLNVSEDVTDVCAPSATAGSVCPTSTYSSDFATISSLTDFGSFGPTEDMSIQVSRVVKEHNLCGEGALWAHLQSLAVSIHSQQTQMRQSMLMFERSASASRNVSNRSKKMWRKKFIMLQREFPRWWGVERKTEIKESFKHLNYSVAVLQRNVQELRISYIVDMKEVCQHFMIKLTEYVGMWRAKREKTMEGFIQNAWKSTQEKEQIICDREEEICSFKASLKNSEEKAVSLLNSYELEIDKLKEIRELEIDKLKESHATIVEVRILELKEIHKTEVDEMKDKIDVLEKLVSSTQKEMWDSNNSNEKKIRALADELLCSKKDLLKKEKELEDKKKESIVVLENLDKVETVNKNLKAEIRELSNRNLELGANYQKEKTTMITKQSNAIILLKAGAEGDAQELKHETAIEKDKVASLKKENEKLKKENSELTKKCAAAVPLATSSAEKTKLEERIKSCQAELVAYSAAAIKSASEKERLVNDIDEFRGRVSDFNNERATLNARLLDCEHQSQRRFLHTKLFSWTIELELSGLNIPLSESWKNFQNLKHNFERRKMGMIEKRRTEKKEVDFEYMKKSQTTEKVLSLYKRDFFAGYGMADAITADVNCPITTDLLENPVVAHDGHTYEQKDIAAWFRSRRTSPKTQATMPTTETVENTLLKKFIGCMMDFSNIHTLPSDIFVCPLSKKSLTNPSIAFNGVTYDTDSIKAYMNKPSNANYPNSRTKITKRTLFPNFSVRSILFTLSGNTVVAHRKSS